MSVRTALEPTDRRRLLAVAAAMAAYAAVVSRFDAFTWPSRIATGVPIAVAVVVALRLGWHRPGPLAAPPPFVHLGGMAVWTSLIAAAVWFQLAVFRSAPREEYPTLSSLARVAFGWPPVRAVAFWAWLLLGLYVLVRR